MANIPYPTAVKETLMESRHMLYVRITLTLGSADVLDYGAFHSFIHPFYFAPAVRAITSSSNSH